MALEKWPDQSGLRPCGPSCVHACAPICPSVSPQVPDTDRSMITRCKMQSRGCGAAGVVILTTQPTWARFLCAKPSSRSCKRRMDWSMAQTRL